MIKGSKEHYQKVVIGELKKELNVSTVMAVPKVEKITINMGLGEAKNNKNVLTDGLKILTLIAGQQAVSTLSKKDIAGFKVRIGVPIGAMVTLRRKKMWDFLTRLINIDLPRIRDFHGLSVKSFDLKGNYSFGIKDYSIFPELGNSGSGLLKGLSINIATNASSKDSSFKLLKAVGIPFQK